MASDLFYTSGILKAKFLKDLGSECPCKYPNDKYIVQDEKVYEKVDAFK